MTTLLRAPEVEIRALPSLEDAATRAFFDVVDHIRRAYIEPPKTHYYRYAHQGARMALAIKATNYGGAVMVCVSGDAAPLNSVLGLLAMNISLRLKLEVRIEHGALIVIIPANTRLPHLASKPEPLPKVPTHIRADDELHTFFTYVLNQYRNQGEPQRQVGDRFAFRDEVHGAVSIEVVIDAITTGMPGDETRVAAPMALSVLAAGLQDADEKIVDLPLFVKTYGLVPVERSERDTFGRRHFLLPIG